jgi:hypothetical protein
MEARLSEKGRALGWDWGAFATRRRVCALRRAAMVEREDWIPRVKTRGEDAKRVEMKRRERCNR